MGKLGNISFAEAAYQVLLSKKIAMSPKEIADIIVKKGMLQTRSARPGATLSPRLKKDKRFVHKGRGLWTIK